MDGRERKRERERELRPGVLGVVSNEHAPSVSLTSATFFQGTNVQRLVASDFFRRGNPGTLPGSGHGQ